jgi:PAS domain S-box-containing protein
MTDAGNSCTYLSRFWRDYTGRDPKADVGFKWVEALHPDDRDRAARDLITAAATQQPCSGEYRVKRIDGEYGWLSDYGVPHFHVDGSYAGHIGTCMDVTELKKRDAQSGRIKTYLLQGQEAERRRVARELHDDVSQRLALVCIALETMVPTIEAGSLDLANQIHTVREQVQSIAADIYRLSHNLHPSTVSLGLTAALRRLCRDFGNQKQMVVIFTDNGGSINLSQDVSLALFRITQECLTNVAKHSGSQQARVSLKHGRGELLLTVSDEGAGLNPAKLNQNAGLGFVSIQERARMIGADVAVKSGRSKGTVVEVRIPVTQSRD